MLINENIREINVSVHFSIFYQISKDPRGRNDSGRDPVSPCITVVFKGVREACACIGALATHVMLFAVFVGRGRVEHKICVFAAFWTSSPRVKIYAYRTSRYTCLPKTITTRTIFTQNRTAFVHSFTACFYFQKTIPLLSCVATPLIAQFPRRFLPIAFTRTRPFPVPFFQPAYR